MLVLVWIGIGSHETDEGCPHILLILCTKIDCLEEITARTSLNCARGQLMSELCLGVAVSVCGILWLLCVGVSKVHSSPSVLITTWKCADLCSV